MDNENPTIIEVADLPTRKRERRTKKNAPRKIEDLTGPNVKLPWDDDDDADDDSNADGAGEPIDEQEIFGKNCVYCYQQDKYT